MLIEKIEQPTNPQPGDILITEQQIKEALQKIAQQIAHEYHNQQLLIISILKGAFIVTADLERELYKQGLHNIQTSFTRIKTYQDTKSSQKPQILQPIDIDITDKHILLVDDIIDTGITLQFLHAHLTDQTRSIKSFALISKPDRRLVNYNTDFTCFQIPNLWIQGYGLDTNEQGRPNPNIILGPIE